MPDSTHVDFITSNVCKIKMFLIEQIIHRDVAVTAGIKLATKLVNVLKHFCE